MKKRPNKKVLKIPTTAQLEKELQREKYKFIYKKLLKSTIFSLIIVVAISTLTATFIFPVFRIYGKSMNPVLKEGDIVLSIKKSKFESGDIIAFYYQNHILVKRVIATSSDWVTIDTDGNVFVNNQLQNEIYIEEKCYGNTDIEFPYQVPEGSYFVLGDQRESSVDSRSSLIGSISEEEIIGKVIFRVWPMKRLRIIQ